MTLFRKTLCLALVLSIGIGPSLSAASTTSAPGPSGVHVEQAKRVVFKNNSVSNSPPLSDAWMTSNAPALLAPGQAQALYDSLIAGYEVPSTGLFLSFPATDDRRLAQQAATYDQAVTGVLLLALGDTDRVRPIVRFMAKAWKAGPTRSGLREGRFGLANFYNAYFGIEGIEKTTHVGPNAWVGLLASRYYRRTRDPEAKALALAIATWIRTKVPHEGGAVAMGEIAWNGAPWPKIYSTENNLSTYAFLDDLLKADLSPDERSAIEHERRAIEAWLLKTAHQADGAILRGFHPGGLDQAGAVDSYTWYLSALSSHRLRANGIDTTALVERAIRDFTVTVEGKKGVDCVDQAMATLTYEDALRQRFRDDMFFRPHDDQHRLIWFEGTGQFIVFLQDAARGLVDQAMVSAPAPRRALLDQAHRWLGLAKDLTIDFDRSAIALPWGTGYPCATRGRFYLYGWPAPAPAKDHPADAVAALVWRLMAGLGYEPLSDRWVVPGAPRRVKMATQHPRRPAPTVVMGASEEMVTEAWKRYESGQDDAAWRQAKATVDLWEADAKILQTIKKKTVGTYLPFDGSVDAQQNIHHYWALNDVAAAYYILAHLSEKQGRVWETREYLKTILNNYSLAQIWDQRGWFWNPIDSIQEEYVNKQPDAFGELPIEQPPALPAAYADPATAPKPSGDPFETLVAQP